MAEQIATTSDWNLPIDEIIEEAMDMIGTEYTSGYSAKSARRSLNLLMTDLKNRSTPLLHLEKRTLNVTSAGGATYNLDTDVLNIIDATVTNADGEETPLSAMSWLQYFQLSSKDKTGTPNSYVFDRTAATPTMTFYLVPDANFTITYWAIRKHKDISASYQLLDLNTTFLPAITMGLAYFIGFKNPKFPLDRLQVINTEYEIRLDRAFGEDRDRTDIHISPKIRKG